MEPRCSLMFTAAKDEHICLSLKGSFYFRFCELFIYILLPIFLLNFVLFLIGLLQLFINNVHLLSWNMNHKHIYQCAVLFHVVIPLPSTMQKIFYIFMQSDIQLFIFYDIKVLFYTQETFPKILQFILKNLPCFYLFVYELIFGVSGIYFEWKVQNQKIT